MSNYSSNIKFDHKDMHAVANQMLFEIKLVKQVACQIAEADIASKCEGESDSQQLTEWLAQITVIFVSRCNHKWLNIQLLSYHKSENG